MIGAYHIRFGIKMMNLICEIVVVLMLAAVSHAATGPNVVLILTDDQGYNDLGCYGSPLIKTPRIDALAAQGMRFTDFHTPAPVCTPTRAALLTGCYPTRVDCMWFAKDGP